MFEATLVDILLDVSFVDQENDIFVDVLGSIESIKRPFSERLVSTWAEDLVRD